MLSKVNALKAEAGIKQDEAIRAVQAIAIKRAPLSRILFIDLLKLCKQLRRVIRLAQMCQIVLS